MKNPWKGKSLLSLADHSPQDIRWLLDLSHTVKKEKRSGSVTRRFEGKTLALIFEKRSTRTRCAFETAFGEEGGHPVFLSTQDIQLGAKESIEDTARVLGRMFDAIEFRGFRQETVEALAQYSGVPVYNGLTDIDHPTQVLADLMTVEEEFGKLEGVKLVFVGDGRNNVARALMTGCSKMGVDYSIVSPASLFPDEELLGRCRAFAQASGSRIALSEEPEAGLAGAHAVYTDVWVSMGEEAEAAERMRLLAPYQVNAALMKKTGRADTIFLHCLPAVKGSEVTAGVIDGPSSRAWDEAENRKHTIKALMLATL
ncbi:MAG: ornithine carbamoyltransferase [Spirochaetaceae bacterium]|nr:ornithine carbamoyltransferase [Spirochaetaceae bacterium]